MIPNRKWLPSAWMDEMTPLCADHPEQFITRDPHYGIRVVPIEVQRDGNESDLHGIIMSVRNGEDIAFQFLDDRGDGTITVHEDGTWDCEPDVGDPGCLYWIDRDPETISPSIEDLVANCIELTVPGTYEVEAYYWSDDIMFRVCVLESGEVQLRAPEGVDV